MRLSIAAAVTALGLTMACALAAPEVPTVAVITGDLLGGGGPQVAQLARARRDAVTRALDKAGIPYQLTADTTVAKSGLPDVPVAILPYNRAISNAELQHLRAFLARPGYLIVFYSTGKCSINTATMSCFEHDRESETFGRLDCLFKAFEST